MISYNKNIDVILLCGGKGQRLRPHTINIPKPLLLVNKKPFLYYMIKKFLRLNVNQIILAAGYKSNKVSIFVKKYFKNNKKIKLVDSGDVDIVKRIQDCSKYIKNDFFICYGDTYVNFDLNKYITNFKKKNKIAYVLGTFFRMKYGTISFNKKTKLVTEFNEKPLIPEPINLGYFLIKKDLIPMINNHKSWLSFVQKLSKSRKLNIKITDKKYFSFDSPREYQEVKTKFIN
jgi:NDP-sugar pyrophosphorylase family protein|tara:strand:+ start:240 stop:932 length:693 start_codon:yes stop_codon:yes gene_type:complete